MDSLEDRDGAALRAEDVLAALGLSLDEQRALMKRGFVAREAHGSGVRYKLRWRSDGRQRVKCLGADPAIVAQFEQALADAQTSRRWRRDFRQQSRDARPLLRHARGLIAELERLAAAARKAKRSRTDRPRRRSGSRAAVF